MVLALAWAVYLIPKALKHHDEVARTRSIDRFSTAMRVLARREPVNRRDARLVVTPARPATATRMVVPQAAEAVRRPAARRVAARQAARRRRRVLLLLVLADVVVADVAAFGYLPWWSVAVPTALTVLWLVVCRRQVRRLNDASWTTPESASAGAAAEHASVDADAGDVAPRRAIRVEAPYGTPVAHRNAQGFEEVSADEDTVMIPAVDLSAAASAEVEAVAVTAPTVDGGSLWDPLPVTLPTYVSKPRAARTVRTINLDAPGTWSSGRSEADSKLVEDAVADSAPEDGSAGDATEQRAVGS